MKKTIAYLDYVENESHIFYSLLGVSLLLKRSKENAKDEFILDSEKSAIDTTLFGKGFSYGKNVVFIPMHARFFLFYDGENEKLRHIDIPNIDIVENQWAFFSESWQFEEYVYAFGYNFPGIVKLNLITGEVNVFLYNDEGEGNIRCVEDSCLINNMVYIPMREYKKIIRFNIKNESIEYLDVVGLPNDTTCKTISVIVENFILGLSDGNLAKWNAKTGECEIIKMNFFDAVTPNYMYSSSYNESLYLVSYNSKYIIGINYILEKKPEIEKIIIDKSIEIESVYYVKGNERKFWLCSEDTGKTYVFDFEGKRITDNSIHIDTDNVLKKLYHNTVYQENKHLFSLESFIGMINMSNR